MSAEEENEIVEGGDSGENEGVDSGISGGDIGNVETGTMFISEIPAAEMFATISETYELHNGNATVQLRCRWDDRYDAVQKFLEGGDDASPREYPFNVRSTGTPMLASSIRIEPFQTKYKMDGQAITYKMALITLNYQMMATELKIDSTTQWLTIPPIGLYWRVNDKMRAVAPDEAPGIRFAGYEMSLTHPHIKSRTADGTNILDYEGYVNDHDIYFLYNGVSMQFKKQTLLCSAPAISIGASLYESGYNNISIKLSYNPIGHNEFFNPLQNADSDATIDKHKVKLYKKISDSGQVDATNNNDGNNENNDENSPVDEEYVEGNYRRVVVYPERDFIPLFTAFGIRAEATYIDDGNDSGGDNTNPSGDGGDDNGGDEGGGGTTNPEVADLGIEDGQHHPGN